MLSIFREDKLVVVKVGFSCLPGWTMKFTSEQKTEVDAELSFKDLNKSMRESLECIRRQEYEQGWKDAKGRRAKKRYFDMGWYIK